jgi:hypothetical protein
MESPKIFKVKWPVNTVLLISRWRGKGVDQGEAFDYTACFLAVYALEDGRWMLISDISVPLE